MRMPPNTQHNFARIPQAMIQRSQFVSKYTYKTNFDAGFLVPFYCEEVLPGDTFNVRASMFARLATLEKPIMDNIYLDTFFFFVPNRLIWNNWEKFNGAQDDPDDSTDFLVPQSTAPVGGYAIRSLQDYMGLPPLVAGYKHNVLFTRAYNFIWNQMFRDQNLQDSVVVDKGDGPDTVTNYTLLRRGKRHDYFTSALPWPQKGTSIDLPLGTTAPVWGSANLTELTSSTGIWKSPLSGQFVDRNPTDGYMWGSMFGPALTASQDPSITQAGNLRWISGSYAGATGSGLSPAAQNNRAAFLDEESSKVLLPNSLAPWYADLSDASASTINQFRQAFQIQMLLERDALGGTRYVEILRAHFGVISPDFRLQRPEYLGGGSTPINVVPVAQTGSTDVTTPQGNLSGYATASVYGNGFVKSFVEHGVIIGMMSARADLTYQQGLNRMWSRRTRWDFFWPALAHLGEQTVLNKEIYVQGNMSDDDVFGYQERFAEYRYKPSLITGDLRSVAPQSLDIWHLSQEFTSLPVLNEEFIEEDPPIDRVIAVPSESHFIADIFMDLKYARPMPVFGVPGLITRL